MELLLSNPLDFRTKKYQRTRRSYMRYDASGLHRKNRSTSRLGVRPRRGWKIKVVPKMRLKVVLSSPLRVWKKLKNGYVNMMLNLVGDQNKNVFGDKRVPMGRQLSNASSYSPTEFNNRLVLEIYKSLVATST